MSYILSLIFIHGINATSDANWVKDGHEWIVDDLPQDVHGIRISTFGFEISNLFSVCITDFYRYNSKVVSDASFGRIRDFAKQFLEALLAERGATVS